MEKNISDDQIATTCTDADSAAVDSVPLALRSGGGLLPWPGTPRSARTSTRSGQSPLATRAGSAAASAAAAPGVAAFAPLLLFLFCLWLPRFLEVGEFFPSSLSGTGFSFSLFCHVIAADYQPSSCPLLSFQSQMLRRHD